MRPRNTRTDKDMELSGDWIKLPKVGGKYAWRHESGVEVAYDCGAWLWRIDGGDGFKTLQVARMHVEAGRYADRSGHWNR